MQQTSLTQFKGQKEKNDFKCFLCGVKIFFKPKMYRINAKGKKVKMPFNVSDNKEHFCNNEQKENYKNTDDYKKNYEEYAKERKRKYLNWLKWWHGYGKYRYKYGYKDNYNKYNRQEYNDRWNQNNQKREQYKNKYHNSTLNSIEALKILGLTEDQINKIDGKIEKLRAVKNAYRVIALKFHPDRFNAKNPTATEAEKQQATAEFRKATEAWELLESLIMKV